MLGSAAAGAGGTVASLGLEGLQELQGYNKESAVEVLKNAGTEGAFIGAATFVLGRSLCRIWLYCQQGKSSC